MIVGIAPFRLRSKSVRAISGSPLPKPHFAEYVLFMMQIRKAAERGKTQIDWLESYHSFSFGDYFDPKELGFSMLRVINDDKVHSGRGFGTHPHRDMEIFTYVLKGALEHRDSMGNGSTIRPGDVQMMSAGSGITHSEFNPSANEEVHLLQIWIVPYRMGVKPRYQQVHFSNEEKRGKLKLIISPKGDNGSLSIYQDALVYAGLLDGSENFQYELAPKRYAYVHVARGKLTLNDQELKAGDGVRIRESGQLLFSKGDNAEILFFDLPPHETPEF